MCCFPPATFLGKIFETLGLVGIYQRPFYRFGSTLELEGRRLPGSFGSYYQYTMACQGVFLYVIDLVIVICFRS